MRALPGASWPGSWKPSATTSSSRRLAAVDGPPSARACSTRPGRWPRSKRAEAVRAERIVAAEADRFREWQGSLAVVPAITSLRAHAEEIRTAELARVEARLGRLPEGERRVVEAVTAQIVNKLLHLPTVRMKEAAVTPDGVIYADVVRHLFGLGEDDET